MKISVIIPVYNVADYLEKCIDSVLDQQSDEHEIILVDDGSTDGISPGICDKYAKNYPNRISVIHQENKGLGGARNTGIESAKGEYLLFVDSDDSITPDAIGELLQYIDRYHADVYDFGFYICKANEEPMTQTDHMLKNIVLSAYEDPTIMEANPTAWTRLWKKSLFLDNDILYPSRVWYEDIRTTEKLFVVADSIVSIPKCFYNYLVRENSITHNKNIERNREILEAFDDLISWFKTRGYYDHYYEELCRLAIEHIFIAGSVRVLRIDKKSSLLKEFRDYMNKHFPGFQENQRITSLSRNQMMVFKMLCKEQYGLINKMFQVKDRIS